MKASQANDVTENMPPSPKTVDLLEVELRLKSETEAAAFSPRSGRGTPNPSLSLPPERASTKEKIRR